MLAIIVGCVCIERFITSFRRVWRRRMGREGFSQLNNNGFGGLLQ
jgi:hypothetical protein